ncbi:MAG TPA: MFS transporter [Acidimicrobiales bacterium]|nr:MFS transporter [Acidimicrobiales bacterium]
MASQVIEPPASTLPGAPAQHDRRWLALAVLGLAQLMVVLDATIVNIALPTAQHALGFSNADRQWIVTGYALSFGSLLLLGGRLSDMIGRKRALMIGLAGFAVASAVGGFSTSFAMLLFARVLQGAFGALLAPAALAMLTTTFVDPAERGRAFGIYGAIAGGGGAIGLLLGGVLTSYASWRWTLFVNLAIGAIAIIGAAELLSNSRATTRPHLDIPGVLTATVGLFALVFGFSHAETTSWGDTYTVASLVIAAVLLAVFVAIERRVSQPLLPLRIVIDRNRGGAFIAMFVAGSAMFGTFLFLTYYMQGTLGYSPVVTGFAYLPMIAALVGSAQVATNVLLPRFGPKFMVAVGMVMAGVSMVILTSTGLHSSYVTAILPALVILGLGFGLIMAPSMSVATVGVPSDAGIASAMVNTTQQVGGSVGTSLLNTLGASAVTAYALAHHATATTAASVQAQATLHGYHVVFSYAAIVLVVGAVVVGLLLRRGPTALPAGAADGAEDAAGAEPVLVTT